ncbi:FadR/GntR family transcriptional regulator [Amycolatopsis sp. A1MSW2902]|uniref:FadR/GntR family transcriptional regulator n=1 Tax=Amycolatopsis sp. A1MSW2902 TaxID=687413 RepID=UPI00307E2F09
MTSEPTPELFRPARPRRVFDEIIEQIQELISSGQLGPGDRLPPERVLVEQFMVSRNTIREALRMLEISGVITLRRGRQGGAFITEPGSQAIASTISHSLSLTDFSLKDLTDCMRWLCGMVIRIAGPLLTEKDFARLAANTDAGAEMQDADDRVERALILTEFYTLLAQAADNPVLTVLVESLTSVVRALVPRLETPDHTFVIRARRRLLTLLRRGEIEAAAAELDKYLVRLHKRWLKSDDGSAIQTVPINLLADRQIAGKPF